MKKEDFINDLKRGHGLSEELQEQITNEQLEDSTNKPTREQWLKERKSGIGGSDASAIVGLNPYSDNIKLWEIKTNRAEQDDISDKPYVQYGVAMEDILRQSFAIKHPEFEVIHEENTIIRHPKYPFLFASLDGILINKETGEKGVLEIKTSEILRSMQKEKWKNQVPDNYYIQVLHYLNVTGFSFAYLFAELTYSDDLQMNRTYEFHRENLIDEMNYLQEKEIEFWKYVEEDKRPPLVLPNI